MTKNGKLIYNIICSSTAHPTAEEIYLKLKASSGSVVLATVYNNLNSLCEGGYIRKIVMENAPDRYDTAVRHDHLICKECGAISDFFMDDITELLEKKLGAPILSYDLKCSYICPECRDTQDF